MQRKKSEERANRSGIFLSHIISFLSISFLATYSFRFSSFSLFFPAFPWALLILSLFFRFFFFSGWRLSRKKRKKEQKENKKAQGKKERKAGRIARVRNKKKRAIRWESFHSLSSPNIFILSRAAASSLTNFFSSFLPTYPSTGLLLFCFHQRIFSFSRFLSFGAYFLRGKTVNEKEFAT